MELTSIGMEILRRELEHDGNSAVIVTIGKPELFPDDVNYYCPFKIEGMGNDRIRYAGGVDSVQALYLGLKMISSILLTSEAWKAGKLTWLGKPTLGFPAVDALKDLE